MISVTISVFALVFVVGVSVIVGWTISDLRRQVLAQASSLDIWVKNFKPELAKLAAASPVKLAAEVAELSEAVERLRRTHQRFAGRFDQYVKPQRGAVYDADTGAPLEGDEELEALLALQTAKPAAPR